MREMKDKPSHLSLVEPFEFKLYVQSNDPDTFGDPDIEIPSMIAELTYNFSDYKPDDKKGNSSWMKIYNYPTKLSLILDTIRQKVKIGNQIPGQNPTLCCALTLGLPYLSSRGPVVKLGELNRMFRSRRKTGNVAEIYIHTFLKSRVDCIVESGTSPSVEITTEVKNQINQISQDTGLTISSVALLAIYSAVVKQDYTPDNYKEEWENLLDVSISILECKVEATKAMMTKLEEKYGKAL